MAVGMMEGLQSGIKMSDSVDHGCWIHRERRECGQDTKFEIFVTPLREGLEFFPVLSLTNPDEM